MLPSGSGDPCLVALVTTSLTMRVSSSSLRPDSRSSAKSRTSPRADLIDATSYGSRCSTSRCLPDAARAKQEIGSGAHPTVTRPGNRSDSEREVGPLRGDGVSTIILDLQDVTFIDSTGMHTESHRFARCFEELLVDVDRIVHGPATKNDLGLAFS